MFANPYGFTSDNSHDGIPLRIQASQEALPRATVGEVYAQILSDLEDAKDVLPANNGGYATSWAVKAYLARVHFQMNDFQAAYDYSNEVISGGGFVLDSSVMGRFTSNINTENIFNLISTGSLNNSGAELGGIYRSTATPPIRLRVASRMNCTSPPPPTPTTCAARATTYSPMLVKPTSWSCSPASMRLGSMSRSSTLRRCCSSARNPLPNWATSHR